LQAVDKYLFVARVTVHPRKIVSKAHDVATEPHVQKFLRQRSNRFALVCHIALLASAPAQIVMEVRRVDLALKLNVLAACAAFVLVGAILPGAF
jgi:hypothetical protein